MSTKYVRPQLGLMSILEKGQIAEFFDRAEAAQYIGTISVRRGTVLDITATAEKIGIPIEYDKAMIESGRYVPRITQRAGPAPRVILKPGDPDSRLTFGHEIGHHFLDDELGIGYHLVDSPHEQISEAFCEFFGHKMADGSVLDDLSLEREVKEIYGIPGDYRNYIMEMLLES